MPVQVRTAHGSGATSRVPEEDLSTIGLADEHREDSFTASEVAVSMILHGQGQPVVGGAPVANAEQGEAADSDTSSLPHDGLLNDTQLVYPQPGERVLCVSTQPRDGNFQLIYPQPRDPASCSIVQTVQDGVVPGASRGTPVAVYSGREPPAQVSVGTNASSSTTMGSPSTGPSDSEVVADRVQSLESWCSTNGLSEVVLQRLRDERFQCPAHLVHLDKEDMRELTDGLRLGEKCSFFSAVSRLRA
eukprot:CAMPEP_0171080374 /NCGR_PEP_ID=MMETSP0766_2-20121228/15828_1 /TAXON_ID=439317 /ORGANISM="Gambierdiscus australes, Strain CAWD 149" /LENGTH=245 /DNA_ID=CAMNT_0011537609 /DNA_START=16 /DNA_END=753 /DNA_ORIENTATION=+